MRRALHYNRRPQFIWSQGVGRVVHSILSLFGVLVGYRLLLRLHWLHNVAWLLCRLPGGGLLGILAVHGDSATFVHRLPLRHRMHRRGGYRCKVYSFFMSALECEVR
jgi:hypothetical protein